MRDDHLKEFEELKEKTNHFESIETVKMRFE